MDRRARIENIWLRRPVRVTAVVLGLCGLALTQFPKVQFDYNLLNMQSRGLPAVAYSGKLIHSASNSLLFAAVVADSLAEALAFEAKIRPLDSVADVKSMSARLTGDQKAKLALIGGIKQEIAGTRFAEMDSRPVAVEELSRTLWSLQGYLGLAAEETLTNNPGLHGELTALRSRLVLFRKEMLEGDPAVAGRKLAAFQQALFSDIQETFTALQQQDNRGPLRAEDLPPQLRERFIGVHGKILLQVFPKKDVWQRANQEEFIRELRHALDPLDTNSPIITGTPVQLYEYTSLLKQSYETAAWYALAAISILVFLHFRSIVSVLLALVPVAVGSIWLGGIMG